MIELRDYQNAAIDQLRAVFRNRGKRAVLCAPTGAGKTVMFAYMAMRAAQADRQVLILANQRNLINQISGTLYEFDQDHTLVVGGEKDPDPSELIIVGTVQTVEIREYEWIEPYLVIVDEAHMGHFHGIYDRYPSAYYVGATATPVYATNKLETEDGRYRQVTMRDHYDDLVQPISVPELIEKGKLVPPHYITSKAIDTAQLKLGKSGEYTEASLDLAFFNEQSMQVIEEAYRTHCEGLKTIIFACSKKHADALAERLGGMSVHSGKKDRELREAYDYLNQVPDALLVNVDMLTKGFDCPSVRMLLIARSIASPTLWIQVVGRGARPCEGKDVFGVVDLGGNRARHGGWEQEVDWRYHFFEGALEKGKGEDGGRKESSGDAAEEGKEEEQGAPLPDFDPDYIQALYDKNPTEMSLQELIDRRKVGSPYKRPYSRGWIFFKLAEQGAREKKINEAAKALKMSKNQAQNLYQWAKTKIA